MKTKYLLLVAVLTIALTLSMFGKHKNADMKKHDMMGKPTVDATVEGLHMKVWLMTQKQHKKMMKENKDHMTMGKDMKGMKHDDMKMDKETKKAMMAGTHHIMVDATDATSGKEIDSASATVMIISPSKKNSSVDLKSMMNCFGSGLTLKEKGKYTITVHVIADGVSKSKEFQYTVK